MSLKGCERAQRSARHGRPSDWERRRPGRIWLDRMSGKNLAATRRADGVRVTVQPLRRRRQIRRDERDDLSGEAAKRTLIATMARRDVIGWSFIVVDLGAELRPIAKQRLKLGRDRRVVGAGERGRGHGWRRRGGGKLNEKRESDEERRERRTERR